MQERLQRLIVLVEELRALAPVRVGDVVNRLYSQLKHQGIYEIREPDDKETVYIGKTSGGQDGLAQRIWDHAHGSNGGSSLTKTLGVTCQEFAEYRVRSLPVPDARFRGLAELFGIALCDPKGNRVDSVCSQKR